MPFIDEPPSPEQVQRQISAMGDSVYVINQLIEKAVHTEETHNEMDRNYRHLEIMLAKEHIQNSGADLTVFTDAIANGIAFNAVPL